MSRPGTTAVGAVAAAVVRGLLLAVVWWIVAEGSAVVAWPYAAAVVAVATVVSLWLVPPRPGRRLRPLAALRFAGWFLWASLRGGTDVAVRALSPGTRIDPGVVERPLRLRGSAAVALADVVSLMPGTLAVAVQEDRLVLHVLDRGSRALAGVDAAEERLAAVLGLRLDPDGRG